MKKLLLLAIFSASLVSCKNAPKVDICISNPAEGGASCVRPDKSDYDLPYEETDNFVMFSPEDAKQLLDFCRMNRENEDSGDLFDVLDSAMDSLDDSIGNTGGRNSRPQLFHFRDKEQR